MNTLLEQHYKSQESKLIAACGQLGAYESLMDYAIQGLKGETCSKGEELAEFLQKRHTELLEEQRVRIFGRKKELA